MKEALCQIIYQVSQPTLFIWLEQKTAFRSAHQFASDAEIGPRVRRRSLDWP